MKTITITKKKIGGNNPCFIIAEAGVNHNGNLNTAMKMIDAAKDCRVDAVKFQTFKAKEFISDKKQTYTYKSQGKQITESMHKMFERYEFNDKQFAEIAKYCKKKKIIFLSTPQNIADLELLIKIGVPAIKVGSDDMNNLPLLKKYAQKKLPIIISTGMAYFDEVGESVGFISKFNRNIGILLCVSLYPAKFAEVNLNRLYTLKSNFPNAVIGYSDHTQGILAAIGAVCLGAKIIEKHFTLDKNMLGPDHHFSADPDELKKLVIECRNIEKILGTAEFKLSPNEQKMRLLCRRSIVADRNIVKGERITLSDLAFKRPGYGIPPKKVGSVVTKKASVNIPKGHVIKRKDIL